METDRYCTCAQTRTARLHVTAAEPYDGRKGEEQEEEGGEGVRILLTLIGAAAQDYNIIIVRVVPSPPACAIVHTRARMQVNAAAAVVL